MKHNKLESGFIKGATEFGVEADCVEGYIKQAEETYGFCCELIDQAEKQSNDPGFRHKLAFELLCANMNPEIIKTALEDKKGNELMEMLGKLFSGGAQGLGQHMGGGSGGAGIGGALIGGGGGALTGLLLSKLLGVNPLIGMLLMGSLGGAAGHHFGRQGAAQGANSIASNLDSSQANNFDYPAGTPAQPPANKGPKIDGGLKVPNTSGAVDGETVGGADAYRYGAPGKALPAPGISSAPATPGGALPTPAGSPPEIPFPGKSTSSIDNNNSSSLGEIKMPGSQYAGINGNRNISLTNAFSKQAPNRSTGEV